MDGNILNLVSNLVIAEYSGHELARSAKILQNSVYLVLIKEVQYYEAKLDECNRVNDVAIRESGGQTRADLEAESERLFNEFIRLLDLREGNDTTTDENGEGVT